MSRWIGLEKWKKALNEGFRPKQKPFTVSFTAKRLFFPFTVERICAKPYFLSHIISVNFESSVNFDNIGNIFKNPSNVISTFPFFELIWPLFKQELSSFNADSFDKQSLIRQKIGVYAYRVFPHILLRKPARVRP